MGAPQREDKGMMEIFQQTSSEQFKKHRAMIDQMVDKGYTIESDETDVDEGLKGEMISITNTTVLKPPSVELPLIKLQVMQTYGRYDFENETYEEYETPNFERRTWKKSADIKAFNDPWQDFDM